MINNNAQKNVSVTSLAAPKLELFSVQKDGENIHVYYADIIRLLSEIFRVPYKVLIPSDGESGVKSPDGNWTGKMGMVHRSEVDLAVGAAINYVRFQAVNFSYPYLFSDVTFMTDKPKRAPTSLALLHPFSLLMWILLITAIFLFSCALYIHVYRKETYQDLLFMLFGSLLEKSIDMQIPRLSLKMIISTWFIFIFVIINSYKAVLLSILTLPPLTGIKDISGLAKAAEQNSITCYSYKSTALQQILLESEFVTWRSIGKCLQRNVITSEDAEVAFVKAPSNKAFITSRNFLRPYEEMYFISEDSFFYSMNAFSVSKKFCCQAYLNKKIHQLFATGLFQKIEKDEEFILKLKATFSDSNESGRLNTHILQLEDIKGAFAVLLFGYALSTIVLFMEIAVKSYFQKSSVILIKKIRKFLKKI